MFIEHLRREFYEVLLESKKVLVIASPDVDAVCTCRILQYLFQIDQIVYTLVSAEGIDDLKDKFLEFSDQCKHVILVNCGGNIDVLNLFENPEDTIIFVIDSHRPTHVLNIYDEHQQVRLVSPPGEGEGIPDCDDIFRVDEDEDDESSSDSEAEPQEELDGDEENGLTNGVQSNKRSRLDPARIARKVKLRDQRRERGLWEERRRKLLFDYTEFSYYGAPSSLVMLEVAWTMTRGNLELCWYAIVGLTDYYVLGKMKRANYILLAQQLQSHITQLNNAQQIQRDSTKVSYENDINLFLYRHWTTYDSMKMTPYFACKFKTFYGEKRFHEFLAEVGLPLAQVRQKFSGMDLNFRKPLKDIILKKSEKYGIHDITIPSFTRQVGLKKKYSAIDCHLAALAILESPGREMNASKKFLASFECLASDKLPELEKGIEGAKNLIIAIYKQVQAFMETNTVTQVGNLLVANVSEGGVNSHYFASPNALSLLAQFTLQALGESTRKRSVHDSPLIMIAPQTPDLYLLIGIPPLSADSTANLFGKAFEKTSEKVNEDGVALDCFDPSIIQLRAEDKKKFVDKLLEILTV